MSQVPPDYVPGSDFSTIAAQPVLTTGIPGAELDAEFAAIAETANDTIDRLSEIQRDDGQIRNGMVKTHTLASDVLALLVAGSASIRGTWEPAQSYAVGDLVAVLQPSFSISGLSSPSGANTSYYLGTANENGQTFVDASEEFSMILSEFVNGPTAPFSPTWKLQRAGVTTVNGMTVAGTLSNSAAGFYETTDEFTNGRPVYSKGSDLTYRAIYWDSGASRWKISDDRNSGAFFISNNSAATPDAVSGWTAQLGSSGTPTVSAGTGSVAAKTVTLALQTVDTAYPWNSGGTWASVQGVGAVVVNRSGEGSGLSNASYLAISDHVSGSSFSDDSAFWTLIAAAPSAGNLNVDRFTGDGSTTDFTLSVEPISETNTQVFVDGGYISKSDYAVSGDILTFASAPANAAEIEVVSGLQVEVQTAVIADNSVGTNKLVNGAVTTAKLADGSVTADKLASGAAVPDDSISAAKLQSNSVTTDKIAAGNVTEGKIAGGAVSEDKLATGAVSATKLAASSVSTAKIADAAVTAAKLGASAVETAKINDAAVTTAKIADLNVTGAKVADATLTAAKLVSGTLDSTIDARAGVAKVVCRFTLSSSPALVGNDLNVASVSNTGTGVFRVTFTTALASANYVPQVSIISSNGRTATIEAFSDVTTTYVEITVRNSAGSANNGLNTEAICLSIDAP